MKKSVKVITAVMAAVMSASVLSAAASAQDYFYAPGEVTADGVYYDNGTNYSYNGVYYDNNVNEDDQYTTVYAIPAGSTVTYYDGNTYYTTNRTKQVKVVNTTSNRKYPEITVDTKQSSITYTFLSDAEYAVGFSFINLPTDVVYDLPNEKYTVVDNSIIQVKFYDKNNNAVAVRKGLGKAEVSGDRTKYDISKTAKINNTNVTCYGFTYDFDRYSINSYYLATFYKDGCSYSIKSNVPMSLSEIQGIAKQMM